VADLVDLQGVAEPGGDLVARGPGRLVQGDDAGGQEVRHRALLRLLAVLGVGVGLDAHEALARPLGGQHAGALDGGAAGPQRGSERLGDRSLGLRHAAATPSSAFKPSQPSVPGRSVGRR
jgi:hypothetical protein